MDGYLDADCILRSSPKPLDLEVLFEPFEEQLAAPPVFIEQRDGQRIRLKIVHEEDVHLVRFRVYIDDLPTQLTEHHRKQLIPATETLYVSVSVVLSYNTIELAAVKKIG